MKKALFTLVFAVLSVVSFSQCDIKTYPNPTIDYLIIETSTLDTLSYSLFDTSGRVVMTQQNQYTNRITLDVSQIDNYRHKFDAVYVLVVEANNCYETKKIVLKSF